MTHWVWLSILFSLLDKHCKAAAYVTVYAESRVSRSDFSLLYVALDEHVNQKTNPVAHLRNDFIFQAADKKDWESSDLRKDILTGPNLMT